MGIKVNQFVIYFLLFTLLIICLLNQKTILIKKGSEIVSVTTYKKDIFNLLKSYKSDFTFKDLISPSKNVKLKDGLIIEIKKIS
jgi:uncharacterized protein YabE (DUF348 family)